MKKMILIFGIALLIVLVSCQSVERGKATLYKSPNCGCCDGYSVELEKQGFDVEVVNTQNMNTIKQKYNIPSNMESCHTTIIGDYVIEGHVPFEAVDKLLEENPEIDGIALPDMPIGTPGMPGRKKAPFKIYSLQNGEVSEYITI